MFNSIGILAIGDINNSITISPYTNYAFSTYLDDGIEIIEGSVTIHDENEKIRGWLELSDAPLIFMFDTPSSRSYEGLSLSITLPEGAGIDLLSAPNAYISFITQPVKDSVPVFICYPYRPGGGTPTFESQLDEYILTFSFLRIV